MNNNSMLDAIELTLETNLKMVKMAKSSVSSDSDIETITYIIINELHKMTTDILNTNLFAHS